MNNFLVFLMFLIVTARNFESEKLVICSTGLAASEDALKSLRHLEDDDQLWTLRTSLRHLYSILNLCNNMDKDLLTFFKLVRKETNAIRDADVSLILLHSLCNSSNSSVYSPSCSIAISTFQLISASSRLDFQRRKPLQRVLRKLIKFFTECNNINACVTEARINTLSELQARVTQALQTFTSTSSLALEQRGSRFHSIRIAARSIRYILELSPNDEKKNLKEVQALIKVVGQIHDVNNLVQALSKMTNQDVLLNQFKEMEKSFLSNLYESWFSNVTSSSTITSYTESRIISLLSSLALDILDTVPTHASSSEKEQKITGIEIERRWVLSGLPSSLFIFQASGAHLYDLPFGVRVLTMIQGYLPGDTINERLRSSAECKGSFGMSGNGCTAWEPGTDIETDGMSGNGSTVSESGSDIETNTTFTSQGECQCLYHLKRTIKSGGGLVRHEYEEKVTKELFSEMWPITRHKRLHKIRFIVPVGGESNLFWEIDQILSGPNRTLVVLELELHSERETLPPFPSWLNDYIEEEVTDTLTSSSMANED